MTEITNRPTPESDAQFSKTCLLRGHRDFARRLEQQRDALREALKTCQTWFECGTEAGKPHAINTARATLEATKPNDPS